MVNAFPHRILGKSSIWASITKYPPDGRLTSYMEQLQPNTSAGMDSMAYGASIFNFATPRAESWFLVPYDTPYKARLICQHETAQYPSRLALAYCMGQTYIVSEWCITHMALQGYTVRNAACLSSDFQDIDLRNVTAYKKRICTRFQEICDETNLDGIMNILDLTNVSHVCIMSKPNVQCPPRSFQCKDLSCVPESDRCNNIKDCAQGEDESNCKDTGCELPDTDCQTDCTWPNCKCKLGFFQCEHGGCIPVNTVCDFVSNCVDGSDELHYNELLCPAGQLACSDGKICFDENKWFDGIQDCVDASDENFEENEACSGFECDDFTCIPLNQVDDGIPDCVNAEDEEDFTLQRAIGNTEWPCHHSTLPCRGSVRKCYPGAQHCVYDIDSQGRMYTCRNAGHLLSCVKFVCIDMYKCPMSYCISFSKVCDGIIDCQDSADESNCPMTSCPGMFHCPQEQVCIHPKEVCDGKVHCKISLDDEKYCEGKLADECNVCSTLDLSSFLKNTHGRVISLQNKDIKKLVSSMLMTETSFILLDLGNNIIETVPTFAFQGFAYLKFIFLNNNSIHSLQPSAFMNTGNLQILDLSRNFLTTLSTDPFQGLYTVATLAISENQFVEIEEVFFTHHQLMSSVILTDSIICCMVPSHVACVLAQSVPRPSCKDLFLHPVLSYTVAAIALAILVLNVVALFAILSYKGNFLIMNLSLSDALFGCHLAVLATSGFFYRDRFSFYKKLWTSSVQCYFGMFAFFVSFQQSLFSVFLISAHTWLLIAHPLKKGLFKYFIRSAGISWLVVLVQALVLISLQYTNQMTVVSSHLFCQSPVLAPDMVVPILTLSCFVYLPVLFLFCAFSLGAVVLLKHQDKILKKIRVNKTLKKTMIKKSSLVLVMNFLSLLSVVTVECMLMVGLEIDDIPLISVTLSVMSLSKVCNPWIYTLQNLAQKRMPKKSIIKK